MMLHTGDVLEIGEESAQVIDHVQSGGVLVDGLGVGDVGNIVLRDRQNLAQNGIIIVVLTLEKYSNQLLSGPDIVSRGFVYVRESEDLMEEAQAIVDHAVADCLERHVSDWGKIKNIIRDSLSDFLWKRIKRKPDDPSDHHGSITTVPKDGTKEPYEQTDKGNHKISLAVTHFRPPCVFTPWCWCFWCWASEKRMNSAMIFSMPREWKHSRGRKRL